MIKGWSDSEVRRMKTMRESGMTWPEIGKKLKRTPGSCAAKGRHEGFYQYPAKAPRFWTDEQDAIIAAGLEALSEVIGRPTSAVASRVNSLLTCGHFREMDKAA